MLILGIETSCDETSVAIVKNGRILSNIISSQIDLHSVYGGVVPEIASRQHLKLVDQVILQACQKAEITFKEIDVVAVTRGPGLPSSLLVGVSVARGLALRLDKPLIPIHHMEAHLYTPKIDPPFVALVVSGGHTLLVHVLDFGEHRILGQTLDDAAGEAFDKAAKLIGLGYPGGPAIELKAKEGNPRAYPFPRPMLDSLDWNFSFSGLKTAFRRTLSSLNTKLHNEDHPKQSPLSYLTVQQVADLCASFQAAVVEVLVEKSVRAAKRFQVHQIAVSGGVCCNEFLRQQFDRRCREEGFSLSLADRNLCTDNAGMIALLAERKFEKGVTASSCWDIEPDWILK